MKRPPVALTVAGSDSGGGAGIQADLKTFSALGVFGTSALTAITAQNTVGVSAVFVLPADLVAKQIDAVLSDIGADAWKTGMLANEEVIRTVAERARFHRPPFLVVDPVMVAKSGDPLLEPSAVSALREVLLPLATVVTPNLPEAERLTGLRAEDEEGMRRLAQAFVHELGVRAVVVKGGHLPGPAVDLLYDGETFLRFSAPRVETRNTHGTGCTFASAIASYLARGAPLARAVAGAKRYVTQALLRAYPLGQGHGPLNHFYRLWPLLERRPKGG